MKPWQKGYEIDTLLEWVDKFTNIIKFEKYKNFTRLA